MNLTASNFTLTIENLETDFLTTKTIHVLEQHFLAKYLQQCRWFGGKARAIRHIEIAESILFVSQGEEKIYLFILQVFYQDASSELYQLPFSYTITDKQYLETNFPKAIIGQFVVGTDENTQIGVMYDAVYSENYRTILWKLIAEKQQLLSNNGTIVFDSGQILNTYIAQKQEKTIVSKVLAVEQSNTSIIYEDKFFLKLYRKLDKAINPDLEINRFFAEQTTYRNVASFAGAIEIQEPKSEPIVLAMMQEMISNQGDAWTLMLQLVEQFYDTISKLPSHIQQKPPVLWNSYSFDFKSIHKDLQNWIGVEVYNKIVLLGKRTAEMHLALASNKEVADFAPKEFTTDYQNYLCEHLTNTIKEKLTFLQSIRNTLLPEVKQEIDKILNCKDKILAIIQLIKTQPIDALRVRMHGDYHLGQVLFTGTDFVIIDFEGEPATPFAERRLKHSVLKDVAGMLRSFHYAVYATLLQNDKFKNVDTVQFGLWAETWYHCARGFYLDSYFTTVANTKLIPKDTKSMEVLLKAFLLEKAMYELCYEANNRPTWLQIPLNGILKLIE